MSSHYHLLQTAAWDLTTSWSELLLLYVGVCLDGFSIKTNISV